MKITEITASLGRTIQFEQYQPHNFHVSCKVELEDGETQEAFRKAHLECEKAIKEEIDKVRAVYEKKAQTSQV